MKEERGILLFPLARHTGTNSFQEEQVVFSPFSLPIPKVPTKPCGIYVVSQQLRCDSPCKRVRELRTGESLAYRVELLTSAGKCFLLMFCFQVLHLESQNQKARYSSAVFRRK